MKFCDNCEHLNMTEERQDMGFVKVPRPAHKCTKSKDRLILLHGHYHPRLPTPMDKCPLEQDNWDNLEIKYKVLFCLTVVFAFATMIGGLTYIIIH